METQVLTLSALMLAVLSVCASGESALQNSALSADKRPKYMDTRDLDIFKFMLMSSIKELVEDGRLNPGVLAGPATDEGTNVSSQMKAVAKRMQYMGICMRIRHNTFIPYPCLRSGSK